jgi:N-acetylneuraminic acid mutarotase
MIRFGLLVILSVILFSCSKTQGRPGAMLPTVPTPTISDFTPDTGNVGTIVTIDGFNFSPDISKNTVRFNGVAAEIETASPNLLTVIVPEGALTGRITVTVKQRAFTSINLFTILNGSWLQRADFGGSARGKAAGFSIDGKAYILTGYSSGFESDLWEYDTLTDKWTQRANFPGDAREKAVAFTIGKKGYVGFGHSIVQGEHNDFWEYDPALDAWTRKSDFPGRAREGAVAFSIASTGYVGLGINTTINEFDYKDMWKYDPSSDQWTFLNDFPGSASYSASGLSTDTLGYILFGSSTTIGATKELWKFSPSTGNWSSLPDFPGDARIDATAFTINGKLYAGFGYDLTTANNDIWQYNPGNFTWTQQAICPGPPRSDLVGFAIGNKGYVGTGYSATGDALKDFWQFIP